MSGSDNYVSGLDNDVCLSIQWYVLSKTLVFLLTNDALLIKQIFVYSFDVFEQMMSAAINADPHSGILLLCLFLSNHFS